MRSRSLVRIALQLLEPGPVDVLADQHPLAGERGDHVGDHDERVAAEDPRQRALILGLELVVELVVDPLADLLADRLRGRARARSAWPAAGSARGSACRTRTAAATPGYWTLTATSRPSCSRARYTCPIEAAAIGSSSNSANTSFSGSSSSSSITLRMSLKATVGRGVAERRELALELLAVLVGHQADVEERQHLPDLHRGALHRPERGHDLLGRLDVARLERGLAALLGAGHVGRAGSRLADRLPRRQPPDPGGTPHAGGGDLVLRHAPTC